MSEAGGAASVWARGQGWQVAPQADRAGERWVQPLSVLILVLALMYVLFANATIDQSDTSETDRVNPLNSVVWLGLLVMALPVMRQRWREVSSLMVGSWGLLLLFTYFALSVAWALDPGTSMRRLLYTFVQLVLFATVVVGVRRAPVLHVAIAVVCVVSALADLASMAAPSLSWSDEGFMGLQGQKNQAGLLLMYGCLAAAPCIALVERWQWKLVLAASVVMMAGLLVATRSTTSESVVLAAAVVMPMLLALLKLPRRLTRAVAAVAVCSLLAGVFGYVAWCGYSGMELLQPLRGATFSERMDIWTFVVEQIQQRPWFGAGYGSFWAIDPLVQPSLKTDAWFSLYAIINEGHQGYLDQLATGGVVGLAGSLFVLFRAIVMAGRALGRTPGAAVAWRDGTLSRPTAVFYLSLLLGLIVHNFTESNLFNNNSLLACAFLLCVMDLEKWRLSQRGVRA